MLNSLFAGGGITLPTILICLGASMVLGVLSAFVYTRQARCSRSFATTLALLPLVACGIILVVNGNLGAGLAVAGSFSLVRFRSAQGSAREILAVFLSMALGLCLGAGYVGIAVLLFLCYGLSLLILPMLRLGEDERGVRELRISVPETLDYEGVFEEILKSRKISYELQKVRTADMGSTYQLFYRVILPENASGQELLDAIRTENGNLPVILGRMETGEGM